MYGMPLFVVIVAARVKFVSSPKVARAVKEYSEGPEEVETKIKSNDRRPFISPRYIDLAVLV